MELSQDMASEFAPELREEIVRGQSLWLAVETDLRFSCLSSCSQWIRVVSIGRLGGRLDAWESGHTEEVVEDDGDIQIEELDLD